MNVLKNRWRANALVGLIGITLVTVIGILVVRSVVQRRQAKEKQAASSVARPELVLQIGHSLGVLSVAISPDGKTVLTGGVDNT